MGSVYSAFDEVLDRKVALKVLHASVFGDQALARLPSVEHEARALARLSHPNVVQVYDVGEHDGSVFMAMEFIEGATLRQWLASKHQTWRDIRRVFTQAAHGLAAAHNAGIVHGDFKPDNVLIGQDGRVRVVDFGLARSNRSEQPLSLQMRDEIIRDGIDVSAPLTSAAGFVGTPAYMAPEQFMAMPLDARSDMFSFCVALFEALYGKRPFSGTTFGELAASVLGGDPTPIPSRSRVPARLHRLLTRGLQSEPSDRYPSMDALLEDLAYDPAATRRRLVIAVASVASVALVAVVALSLYSSAQTSCIAASRELAELYNPQRRQRIADAVLASSVPFAASTWDRAAPRLDAYAQAWSASRLDACEAHGDGRQSPRLYDLRTACLDQRRAGFAALLDVLENADDATIPKIAEAVLGLPRLDPCADTEALTAALQPPDDPTTAAAVQDIRERLAQVESYESTGRYSQASDLLAILREDAAPLEYPPIHSEIKLREGVLTLLQFQFDAADQALSAALFDAIAAGHDRIAADAASRLLYVKGHQDPDDAKRELPYCESLVRRLGGAPDIESTYYTNLGALHIFTTELSHARAASKRALDLKREVFGQRHLEVGYTLSNLAYIDSVEGYNLRARDQFVEALAIFEDALGPDHSHTATSLSNLAFAFARMGKYSEALATYARMSEIFAKSPAAWAEIGADILPDRGRFFVILRQLDAATSDFEETLRLVGEDAPASAPSVVQARVGLATVAALRDDWEDVEHRLDELAPLLDSPDPPAKLAVADALDLRARLRARTDRRGGNDVESATMGIVPTADGEEPGLEQHSGIALSGVEIALQDHVRAYELRATHSSENSPLRAHAHLEFARALLRFDRLTDTTEHLAEARMIINAELPPTSPEHPAVAHLTGALQLAKGDPEAAITSLRHAVQLLERAREPDDFDLALTTFDLARALHRRDPGDDDARRFAEQARAMLSTRGSGWRAEVARIDAWLAEPSG